MVEVTNTRSGAVDLFGRLTLKPGKNQVENALWAELSRHQAVMVYLAGPKPMLLVASPAESAEPSSQLAPEQTPQVSLVNDHAGWPPVPRVPAFDEARKKKRKGQGG